MMMRGLRDGKLVTLTPEEESIVLTSRAERVAADEAEALVKQRENALSSAYLSAQRAAMESLFKERQAGGKATPEEEAYMTEKERA